MAAATKTMMPTRNSAICLFVSGSHTFLNVYHLARLEAACGPRSTGGGGVLDRRDVLDPMHGRSRMTIDPITSLQCRTEHVGFSPARQTLLAPSAKRREVSGESHEE